MFTRSILALVASLIISNEIAAGPHLGIKKAARDFEQGWLTKDKALLSRVTTPDLYYLISQTSLPDVDKPCNEIICTTKSNGHGTLVVVTSKKKTIVYLVGKGFKWKVRDVYIINKGTRGYSLKNMLQAKIKFEKWLKKFKINGSTSPECRPI